ncbi:MAG: glucosamine-6-phosphate deaminase [Verrucomicrobiota bacterium]|jgi:glucosamine-6-phosphate deaminase
MSKPVETPHPPLHTFQIESLAVRVYPSQEQLARDAALAARNQLQEAIAKNGVATIILAAAPSQTQTLASLVALEGIDWSKVVMFHMDEYLGIDAEHPASFRRFLREHVQEKIRARSFHCLDGASSEPLDECERYSQLLAAQPIDLCLLGIGENGHLAFNDPPVADFADRHRVKLVKLEDACRRQQVGEGHFPSIDAVPQYAFTLTIPALCAARRMLCVVPERRKAASVRDALRGPFSKNCPASVLRRQPHCTLYLDADSAALI